MRHQIPKEVRQRVYEKYGHHCAYCGVEMEYNEMQVSLKVPYYEGEETECYENYLPACRLCNSYKRALPVESFRKKIESFHDDLMDNPRYKMLQRFSLIREDNGGKVFFYFETHDVAGSEGG